MAGQGTSLKSYLLTRLALVIPMVFILLTIVFLLMRVAPGNPVSASLGGHAPPQVIRQINPRLGFDKPLYVQYGNYLWDILHGDFGRTISDRRPVQDIISLNGAATLAVPVFFLGLLAQLFFGSYLNLLPTSDQTSPLTEATLATHTNILFVDAIIE